VTFKVDGEFEVDLTIADEDFEKQFWFIDFRFAFKPSASSLSDSLRQYLESCVNDALSREGLTGCYQFLHEFVLTCKINELKRQAMHLSRSSWTGTLMVEPLHRALVIQYWTFRTPPTGPKSWVLIAVNSGRKANAASGESKDSSYLVVKWYRDNKHIDDIEIPLDVKNLSAETLLKAVIGRHVGFILSSIHDKLMETSRFKNREAAMVLHIQDFEPSTSYLTVQVGYNAEATLLMEPMTGLFAVKPHSKFAIQSEHHLNNGRKQIEDGVVCLENVRCAFVDDELNRRGSCTGWYTRKAPMGAEEVRSITKVRDWSRIIWLQKGGWSPEWYVGVFLGLRGDEWWLLET
jgi:mediator of RNA polymerase II transcription subunit 14